MREKIHLDISAWTIIKVVLVLIAFYLLYLMADILALFFVVFILASSFYPTVSKWEKKIGKPLSVVALLLILFAIISLFIYAVFPPLIYQTRQLIINLPELIERFRFFKEYIPYIERAITNLYQNLGDVTGIIVRFTTGLFGGLFTVLIALVLTVYLLLDTHKIVQGLIIYAPADKRDDIIFIIKKMALKVGDWFRGQLWLSFIMGILSLVGLLIIGVPYALTLAFIAAVLEFVPTIGPLIAGVIAALVALSVDPIKAIFVIIYYIVIQQLEAAVIVPKLFQKIIGLSPIIIIATFLIGAKLYGLVGALLAVPFVALVFVLITELPTLRKVLKSNNEQRQ